MRSACCLGLALLVAACSSGDGSDAGASDGGAAADAADATSPRDAGGGADAASSRDASANDAFAPDGAADSAQPADAAADAGVIDAASDAAMDAGVDAGADAGIDAGTDAGSDAAADAAVGGSAHVHILIDNFCNTATDPTEIHVPAGQTLKVSYHNHSVDYDADVWLSYGGGYLGLKAGATWDDPFEHCATPDPYVASADVSIAGGPTPACPKATLLIYCHQ